MLPDMELFLEPSEVGRILNFSVARVRDLADEGRLIVAARTQRGLRLFRREDIELYLATVQKRRPSGRRKHRGA